MGKDKKKITKHPFISICTPTFNRRPFIPIMIKCFENQTYPKDKIEWIIVDDGTDKIGDLVSHIPQVKYYKYDEKMTLGKKRNLMNEKATGDIIIYMDDDDYYPPNRVSHAVDTLRLNPKALCAGSSEMFIYFKHIHKMYKFGPYGPNHSTAATFAFRKELLSVTKFDETSCVAEERKFLKDYTIPFAQLDPKKSILVFSHTQNSFDKKELLVQAPNKFITESQLVPADFVNEKDVLQFFMEDIDVILDSYDPGKLEHKSDVVKQLAEIRVKREAMIKEQEDKYIEEQNNMNKLQYITNPQLAQQKINEQDFFIQKLQEKIKYLEDKIRVLISEKIKEKQNVKHNEGL
jgi:glycosyltransferase involved in cell wall biosynthesis